MALVGPTPEQQYDGFVKSTLQHLRRGLELDGTVKKAKIGKVLDDQLSDQTTSAAMRVVEGRFALGGDDAAYLQSGLATLWTTATANPTHGGRDETLAPPGLYAPDAVDGIRQGLVRALQQRLSDTQEQAGDQLNLIKKAFQTLLQIKSVRIAVVGKMIEDDALARIMSDDTIELALKEPKEALALDWTDAYARRALMEPMGVLLQSLSAILDDPDRGESLGSDVIDQIVEQQERIQQLLADKQGLQGQNDALAGQLAAANATVAGLQNDIAKTKRRAAVLLQDCKEGLARRNDAITSLKANVARLTKQNTALEVSLAECEEAKAAVREAIEFSNAASALAAKDRDRCNALLEKAKRDMAALGVQLRKKIATLEEQKTAKDRRAGALGDQLEVANESARVTAEARDESERQIQSLEAETVRLENEMEALRSSIAALEEDLGQANQRVLDCEADKEAKRRQWAALQQDTLTFAQLQADDAAAKQATIEALEERIRTLESTVSAEGGKLRTRAEEVKALSGQLGKFQKRAEAAELKLQSADRRRKELEAQLELAMTARREAVGAKSTADKVSREESKRQQRLIGALTKQLKDEDRACKRIQDELRKQVAEQIALREKTDNIMFEESDGLAVQWRSLVGEWIAEGTNDERQKLTRAREVAKALSVQAVMLGLNKSIGTYQIRRVFSTPEVIENSNLKQIAEQIDTEAEKYRAFCQELQAKLRNAEAPYNNSDHDRAFAFVCRNLRQWRLLYKTSEMPVLLLPQIAEEGDPAAFVPLTAEARKFIDKSEAGKKAFFNLLSYLYNLSSKSKWTLVPAEEGGTIGFDYLRYEYKGEVAEAMKLEKSLVTYVGDVLGAVGGGVSSMFTWITARNAPRDDVRGEQREAFLAPAAPAALPAASSSGAADAPKTQAKARWRKLAIASSLVALPAAGGIALAASAGRVNSEWAAISRPSMDYNATTLALATAHAEAGDLVPRITGAAQKLNLLRRVGVRPEDLTEAEESGQSGEFAARMRAEFRSGKRDPNAEEQTVLLVQNDHVSPALDQVVRENADSVPPGGIVNAQRMRASALIRDPSLQNLQSELAQSDSQQTSWRDWVTARMFGGEQPAQAAQSSTQLDADDVPLVGDPDAPRERTYSKESLEQEEQDRAAPALLKDAVQGTGLIVMPKVVEAPQAQTQEPAESSDADPPPRELSYAWAMTRGVMALGRGIARAGGALYSGVEGAAMIARMVDGEVEDDDDDSGRFHEVDEIGDEPQLREQPSDQLKEQPSDDDEDSDSDSDKEVDELAAFDDASAINHAMFRGLVGQRGPMEQAATKKCCAQDELLSYELPTVAELARTIPPAKRLLSMTAEPTPEAVRNAFASLKRRRPVSEAARAEALAGFRDNFAVVGLEPAASDDKRCGVEAPHAVRWMPRGKRGARMAKVAILEHALARCEQVAKSKEVSATAAAALREAAASLKIDQLPLLYALHQAAERDIAPPAPTTEVALVTRPCAIVRGVLSFPSDPRPVPLPADASSEDQPCAEDAQLGSKAEVGTALNTTAAATAALRTKLRRKAAAAAARLASTSTAVGGSGGSGVSLYVAPAANALRFRPAPPVATGVQPDPRTCEQIAASDLTRNFWRRLVNRAVVYLTALDGVSVARTNTLLGSASNGDAPGVFVGAVERREALWSEFRRNVAISQDRLWVFVRLMSGCVGGDVNEVIAMADEATLKATKAIQDQRVAIAKRVSDMQAKIVETIVGSMARESKLTMDKDGDDDLVVIDGAARKELNDLASGESGRPFFEANVAVRNLQDPNNPSNKKTKLSDLLHSLANVGAQLQESLETTLTQPGAAGASLAELSHPANCYFVSMRTDASAAIRVAHERLNVELAMRRAGRRLSLWELVEGGCTPLTTRFAEFAGYVLVQARSSTGISALYVSQQAIQTNAYQARIGLDKLVRIAMIYATSVGMPAFGSDAADSVDARKRALNAGADVEDVAIGHLLGNPRIERRPTLPSIHVHPSGWGVVGARRW